MKRARIGVLALLACSLGAAGEAWGAGDPKSELKFDTLSGWHVRPVPTVQLVRFGARRQSATLGDHLTMEVDMLDAVGISVSFQPPFHHWRETVVKDKALVDKQWIGFSTLLLAKGGNNLTVSRVGFGLSLDFIDDVFSIGAGVDAYRGITVGNDGKVFFTGIIPGLLGAGSLTRENLFITITVNITGGLFGSSNTGTAPSSGSAP